MMRIGISTPALITGLKKETILATSVTVLISNCNSFRNDFQALVHFILIDAKRRTSKNIIPADKSE
jgi:hypothetical protein